MKDEDVEVLFRSERMDRIEKVRRFGDKSR